MGRVAYRELVCRVSHRLAGFGDYSLNVSIRTYIRTSSFNEFLAIKEDILLRVFKDESRFRDKVASAMTSKLETVAVDQPIEALLPIFQKGHVAIVTDREEFLGLITRIDLLNHLRRRMK